MTSTIMIVEPDAEYRAQLERLYKEGLKAEVACFPGALEAMVALRSGLKPDLILAAQDPADKERPVTGSDLCRAVRGLFGPLAAPPVFVMVPENVPLTPAYQAGATDVLLKPIRDTGLQAKSHMTLAQRARHPAPERDPRILHVNDFKRACRLRSIVEEGGWVFGPYLVADELGRGGIGVVAKAIDTATGELSAIKLLLPDHVHDQEWFSRFRREGRVLTGISHPNLVTNKAIGEENGVNYIAMDYVVGTPLSSVIARRGNIPENVAFDIIAQIARGLVALEENGVVHRDIKPENIMINKVGWAGLIDFGLSKRRGDAQLTQEGEILGTVAFIAPETISGAEPDIKSDIYALGVTLYEMLTGEDLVEARTTREIFLDALRGKTADKAARKVSPKAAAIIEKMMAVSRKQRYASPAALIADIKEAYPESFERHLQAGG